MNSTEASISVNEFRCLGCGKLLAKGALLNAAIEIKCNRCGKLNTLFEEFGDQVVLTDPDGVILYANEKATEITGYSLEEIIGSRPSLWGNQMSREFYEKLWHEVKDLKKAIAVRVTNKKKNGELYDAILRISPILDKDGDIKFFFSMQQKVADDRRALRDVDGFL